jgi:molybdate transport repressor ModE-like protein
VGNEAWQWYFKAPSFYKGVRKATKEGRKDMASSNNKDISKSSLRKLTRLKVEPKVTVYCGKKIRSGEGKDGVINEKMATVLEGIKTYGSILATTKKMGIAYNWAWRAINETEASFGFALIIRDGARGSTLTSKAETLLTAYNQTLTEGREFMSHRFEEILAQ